MDKDRFSDGVFFKWLNQKEIYKKYDNKGRSRRIQAYLDELHEDYIATRPGTDYGEDFHGLFGFINENPNVEKMELADIKKYVANKTLDGVDIYKTVISLSESDAIQYGYTTKEAWKNLLLERVQEVGKEFGIKPENLEWTASYHSKKNNPHCHLLIWNKNQNLEIQKKPFVRYKRIRKALSKSIFKLKLKSLYDIKNVSKKEIANLTNEELLKYKEELKYIYAHGHEIGNHSYSHPDFKKITIEEGLAEIEKTQQIIYKTILHYPRVFRFPYGSVNKEILKRIDMPAILWNADSLDWQCFDSKIIIEKLKHEIKENGILLFHDFKYYNKEAITTIVNDLKQEGYVFVTISELFGFYTDEFAIGGKLYY